MIFWVNNAIGTSIRYYANANRYPWTPSHDRKPVIEAPTGITFVGYENPPGVTTEQRVDSWLGLREGWYNHVNLTAHDAAWPLHSLGGPRRLGGRSAPYLPHPPLIRGRKEAVSDCRKIVPAG